ncbi:hypothetical protein M9458_054842 [Cirrhinus mrigala]|uniref:GTPase IMAP family member 8 n=1 Tax=Cirrhinus mrigala TaxID=683832 RepID=A0ABD0MIX5_CIRMR
MSKVFKKREGTINGRQISVIELPALTRLSEEEVTRETQHCLSLGDPGVYLFILIIPDAPLTDEDKAEMEKIQKIFSSRINKHIIILIKQNSEHQTAELNEETQSVFERFGGRHQFIGPNTQVSVLMEKLEQMTVEINGRYITVIDTPGLFDTDLTNEEIQREISNCISMILPGPHVFLLLIPLGRFTQEEAKPVKIIQEMFGENSLMFTMVVFTRGDDLNDKTIEQYLGEPGCALMKLIESCGNRFHVFNNKETGDQTQVTDLLQKIDNMVKTNGGSYYSCKMFREMEREKQEQQMKMLMEKVEQLNREKEELMNKHEEEKERMKMMMEEERQNREKERKRREEEYIKSEEQYKRDIKDIEEQERKIRKEMKKEREEWENQKQQRQSEEEEKETCRFIKLYTGTSKAQHTNSKSKQ